MNTTDWIAFCGSVAAALIGLIGVYGVYLLNSKKESKRALDERTGASVADLAKATETLSRELQYLFSDRRRRTALLAFVGAVQVFAAREMRDNQTIAKWALMKLGDRYLKAIDFPIKQMPLILRPQLMPEAINAAQEISRQVIAWRAGLVPEAWFADDLKRLIPQPDGQ